MSGYSSSNPSADAAWAGVQGSIGAKPGAQKQIGDLTVFGNLEVTGRIRQSTERQADVIQAPPKALFYAGEGQFTSPHYVDFNGGYLGTNYPVQPGQPVVGNYVNTGFGNVKSNNVNVFEIGPSRYTQWLVTAHAGYAQCNFESGTSAKYTLNIEVVRGASTSTYTEQSWSSPSYAGGAMVMPPITIQKLLTLAEGDDITVYRTSSHATTAAGQIQVTIEAFA